MSVLPEAIPVETPGGGGGGHSHKVQIGVCREGS